MKPEPTAAPDHSQLCRVPNCGRLWAVDILHGRVCSFHDEQFSHAASRAPRAIRRPSAPMPLPTHDAVRPFIEPEEHDE